MTLDRLRFITALVALAALLVPVPPFLETLRTITVLASLVLVVLLCFPGPKTNIRKPKTKPTLRSWKRTAFDYELTFNDGSVYRGNCTVWHSYPSGTRADTRTELWLRDVWQRVQWEEEEN